MNFVGERLADKSRNPIAHLSGRFVGETHRKNIVRLNPLLDQKANAMRDDSRFPASSACQQEEGAIGVLHGLALLRIKEMELKIHRRST